jgi:hypothetical protein
VTPAAGHPRKEAPPVTITVHSAYGHYNTDVDSVIPTLGTVLGLPPGAGFSQVTIAR